jgi:hypothetical protein
MGKVPLLNTETISKRATLALTTMAAKVDKSNSSVPTADSIAAIDDILSVTKGMTFYGAATKTYNNPKDSASGSFCTIPVKYEFKDRETKNQAEKILRKTCNVNCATPYPPTLRECIKQTSEHFRNVTGDNFVRVSVDAAKLVFKVAHRNDKESRWCYAKSAIPIPREALDISARRPPEGFKMSFEAPPPPPPASMDTDPPPPPGPSPEKGGHKSRTSSAGNKSPANEY